MHAKVGPVNFIYSLDQFLTKTQDIFHQERTSVVVQFLVAVHFRHILDRHTPSLVHARVLSPSARYPGH